MAHLREGEPYLQALGFDTIDEIGGPRGTCATDSGYSDYLRDKGLFDLFVSDTKERVADATITRPAPFDEADHMDGYVGRRAVQCYAVDAFPERPRTAHPNLPDRCSSTSSTTRHLPHDPWDAPGRYAHLSMYDPARYRDALVENIDVLPTVLEAVGVPPPIPIPERPAHATLPDVMPPRSSTSHRSPGYVIDRLRSDRRDSRRQLWRQVSVVDS